MADEERPSGKEQWFSVTSWYQIETIQGKKPGADDALESLCKTYWYPLYAYIRRAGRSPADAEDLTQGFFQHLLEKNILQAADRAKGKFRSFLLTALKYYMSNQAEFQMAQKRGGGKTFIYLDQLEAEERYRLEPSSDLSPERIFEQHWVRTLLEQVQEQLRADYSSTGREAIYDQIKVFLSEEAEKHDYDQVADKLNMKVNALAVAVHRLRHRYGELLRAEIARTVADPAEIENEIHHFYSALGNGNNPG